MTRQGQDLVWLIEDDTDFAVALAESFAPENIEIELHRDVHSAVQRLSSTTPDLIMADVHMALLPGHDLLVRALARDPELPVVLMAGHRDIATAIKALKRGAFDVIPVPISIDHLIASARRALKTRRLVLDNRRLRSTRAKENDDSTLYDRTPAAVDLGESIYTVASADDGVVLESEIGGGKETVAPAKVVSGLTSTYRISSRELPLAEQLSIFEASILREALERFSGDVAAVSNALGTPSRSLYARFHRYGIRPGHYRKRQ